MKRFWISWLYNGPFEFNGPWWVSGYTYDHDDNEVPIICAAVKANSVEEAMALIGKCNGRQVQFRFCVEKADDWSPFCDRFPRADWMIWTD